MAKNPVGSMEAQSAQVRAEGPGRVRYPGPSAGQQRVVSTETGPGTRDDGDLPIAPQAAHRVLHPAWRRGAGSTERFLM